MSTPRGNLIIIGASARAAAQSAIRAGYAPWCIDLFADRDLQAIAPVKRCPRETWPRGVLDLLKEAPPGPVLLTGAMENEIDLLTIIERDRPLLCGSSSAVMRLRSPRSAFHALSDAMARWCGTMHWREGLVNCPALHWDDDVNTSLPDHWRRFLVTHTDRRIQFLIKPRRSAGGRGIRWWSPGDDVGVGEYVQQYVPGRSLSGVYFASNGAARLLGVTEQLIGAENFGAQTRFTCVGNIYPAGTTDDVWRQFACVGRAVTEWSGIEGIFGIDAVLPERDDASYPLNRDRIHIVDINPRYPASAELLEHGAPGVSVLDHEMVSSLQARTDRAAEVFIGKAIVYAMSDCNVVDLAAESDRGQFADIPRPGEAIARGHPICTVLAEAPTRDACYAGLRRMAEKVYTRLHPA